MLLLSASAQLSALSNDRHREEDGRIWAGKRSWSSTKLNFIHQDYFNKMRGFYHRAGIHLATCPFGVYPACRHHFLNKESFTKEERAEERME